MEMQLDPREASLVEVFRRLPPDTAAELDVHVGVRGNDPVRHRADRILVGTEGRNVGSKATSADCVLAKR
jgi:hypothetical protein